MIHDLLDTLPMMQTPDWLRAVEEAPQQRFPLEDILRDSLYYPACGLNGTPVKYLSGHVVSFVYADIGVTKAEFLDDLNGQCEGCGFKGYQSVFQREVLRAEVVPANWRPPFEGFAHTKRLMEVQARCVPFGHWSVWRREEGLDDGHGAELFSFFYMGGEVSAIYQGLYNRLGLAPLVLAVVQPGGGIDGSWDRLDAEGSFFKRVVKANRAGMPRFLLYGGGSSVARFYEHPCWREYEGPRLAVLPERHAGLWMRREKPSRGTLKALAMTEGLP